MKRIILGIVLSGCMILNSGMAVFADTAVVTEEEPTEFEAEQLEEPTEFEIEESEETIELMEEGEELESVEYNDNLSFNNMREEGNNTFIFLNEEYTTSVNVSDTITSQYENLLYEWMVYYRDGNAPEQVVYYCYETDDNDPTKITINGTDLSHCVGREDRSFRAEVTIRDIYNEVVARGGFIIHVASTVSELDKIDDIQLLRGWEFKVPNMVHKYVKNAVYPNGKDYDLTVTSVAVRNRYNDGDPVCEVVTAADGWIIRANNIQDTATATVSYNDENGQSASYEFQICVAGNIVEFEYSYPRGTDKMLQSSTMDISTDAKHSWNYGQYGSGVEYLENYTVSIEDEIFGQSYDHNLIDVSIKEDGKTICVQSKGISGECDIKIRLIAEYGNGGTWSQCFLIHVVVVEDFNYISMEEIDANMPLGTSITLNPRVRYCWSTGDNDLTDSWLEMDGHKGILSFDPNVFSITDAKGQTVSSGDMRSLGASYTVKRIGKGASKLGYKVEWNNSETFEYEPVCEKYSRINAVSYDLEFGSKYGVDSQNSKTFIFDNENAEVTVNSNVFDLYDSKDITWNITLTNNDTQAQITSGYSELENGKITLAGNVLKKQADVVKLTLKATAGGIAVVERSLVVGIINHLIDLPDEMDGKDYITISLEEEHSVDISASEIFTTYAGDDLDVQWSVYACNNGGGILLSEGYAVSEDGKTITLDGATFAETSAPHNEGFRAEVQIELNNEVILTDGFGFDLDYYDISKGVIELNTTDYTYTGAVIKPNITVKYAGNTLVEGKDYTLQLPTVSNAGTNTFYAVGMGHYNEKLEGTYIVKQLQSVVTVPYTSITKKMGDASFTPAVTKTGDGRLEFSSSNEAVATVSSAGKITIKGVGKAVISVYATGTNNCIKSSTKTITVTVKSEYTVTFDGNGATSGSMESIICEKDKSYTLKSNAYKRTGYTFDSWNTKKDGSGKKYVNKAEIKNLSTKDGDRVTLYAQWKINTYTITYKLNGGKNNSKNPASYKVTTSDITLQNPTRTGYTFKGWYTDSKLTKKITVIKKGTTGNKTVYAKWAANKYTIKYNANGGSGSMKNQSMIYDKSAKLTKNSFTRKNYTFLGWSTDKKATKAKYKNQAEVKNLSSKSGGTVTLYAIWRKK